MLAVEQTLQEKGAVVQRTLSVLEKFADGLIVPTRVYARTLQELYNATTLEKGFQLEPQARLAGAGLGHFTRKPLQESEGARVQAPVGPPVYYGSA